MTHRTSFAGALVTMAIGAVLAFAVQSSPKYLDLRTAGVILMLGAAADLLIRTLIADSPLLGRESAEVAAVLEPIGEPVLDAAGNPVIVPNPASSPIGPPLVGPAPGTVPQGHAVPPGNTVPPGHLGDTLVVTEEPYPTVPGAASPGDQTAAMPVAPSTPRTSGPDSPAAVTTLAGRPVRPRSDMVSEQRRRWRYNGDD
ncbi:hypothetical protein KDL01_28070 [Actinospica durhamensis]|uniref:Uncharacterized protein n=1 Tax=Actinospica durhamensis TaxID=1508375 RepID=A0A941ETT0_9ACTN|nr:hypothetical protein [Actinospica durhamensis]MBR7837166.1 hypothetical protein [Actinospica durhamensis]